MKLIVNVPLKTVNSQFTLYKVVALPTRVSKTSFVKYTVDYFYFGLESSRHDYILLKEADLLNCVTGEITVCPANMADTDRNRYRLVAAFRGMSGVFYRVGIL